MTSSPVAALYVGTLENGGVGLAPYHDFEDEIPAELKQEVEAIVEGIIDGRASTPAGSSQIADSAIYESGAVTAWHGAAVIEIPAPPGPSSRHRREHGWQDSDLAAAVIRQILPDPCCAEGSDDGPDSGGAQRNQTLPWGAGQRPRQLLAEAGRDPGLPGRERRGQEHPDEHPLRPLHPGRG